MVARFMTCFKSGIRADWTADMETDMAQESNMCIKKPNAETMLGNIRDRFVPSTGKLYVANKISCCQTLGPGKRCVVWVSGCSRKCAGCIATSIQDIHSGTSVSVDQLAEEILSYSDIEGITLSGGEPFEQAAALADLCDILKRESQLSIMSYSGFTFAELQVSTDSGKQRLLHHLDILVDGPFVKSLQADLLWRGSTNQQVLFLRDTYLDFAPFVNGPGAGIEIHISKEGTIFWVGIPESGFMENLERALEREGIRLTDTKRLWI
jgi:anaerobic ribonucleoside-triphosphate reductase activating protein